MGKKSRLKKQRDLLDNHIHELPARKRITEIVKTQKVYYLFLINISQICIFLMFSIGFAFVAVFGAFMAFFWLSSIASGIYDGVIILKQGTFRYTETPINFFINFVLVTIAYIFCAIFPILYIFQEYK